MADTIANSTSIFSGTKTPKNLTTYTLMRGVTDFSQLGQFNLFETGYCFLVVVKIPRFLEKLRANDEYKNIIDNYVHLLEYEFKGLDGIENYSVDTLEISNGISSINLIGKVNRNAPSNISMTVTERSGSPITKLHKLYLEGVRDPETQIKTYHGLIQSGELEAGFENECFTLLYMNTDNTITKLESAYLFVGSTIQGAEESIYNSQRGEIATKDVNIEMACYPLTGRFVYEAAADILKAMNDPTNDAMYVTRDHNTFNYKGLEDVRKYSNNNAGTVYPVGENGEDSYITDIPVLS